jgi:hypothetical protein
LAVMVDTLEPLWCRRSQMGIDDGEYYKSWWVVIARKLLNHCC